MNGKQVGLAVFLAFGTGLGGLGLGHAEGGSITIYDTGIPGSPPALAPQPWTVSWLDGANPGLTITPTPAKGTDRTTALTLNYTFNNLTPITLVFTENAQATMSYGGPNELGKLGLNFSLTEMLTNSTGKGITGFTETLTDGDLQNGKTLTGAQEQTLYNNNADKAHPPMSHFHHLSDPGPFAKPELPGAFSSFSLTGGNPLMDGQTTGMGGVPVIKLGTVHDIVVSGYQRSFTLTIAATPNPEPATLTMLVTAMVVLGGFGFVRKRGRAVRTCCAEPSAPTCS